MPIDRTTTSNATALPVTVSAQQAVKPTASIKPMAAIKPMKVSLSSAASRIAAASNLAIPMPIDRTTTSNATALPVTVSAQQAVKPTASIKPMAAIKPMKVSLSSAASRIAAASNLAIPANYQAEEASPTVSTRLEDALLAASLAAAFRHVAIRQNVEFACSQTNSFRSAVIKQNAEFACSQTNSAYIAANKKVDETRNDYNRIVKELLSYGYNVRNNFYNRIVKELLSYGYNVRNNFIINMRNDSANMISEAERKAAMLTDMEKMRRINTECKEARDTLGHCSIHSLDPLSTTALEVLLWNVDLKNSIHDMFTVQNKLCKLAAELAAADLQEARGLILLILPSHARSNLRWTKVTDDLAAAELATITTKVTDAYNRYRDASDALYHIDSE